MLKDREAVSPLLSFSGICLIGSFSGLPVSGWGCRWNVYCDLCSLSAGLGLPSPKVVN